MHNNQTLSQANFQGHSKQIFTKENVANGIWKLMQGPHAQDMHARANELKNLMRESILFPHELNAFVDDVLNLK